MVWSGFCIEEMSNIKKVYATNKNEGFDIIRVILDTGETELRNYLEENYIPWRQMFTLHILIRAHKHILDGAKVVENKTLDRF